MEAPIDSMHFTPIGGHRGVCIVLEFVVHVALNVRLFTPLL